MKKLIVWSVDALFTSDLVYAKTLPGFQELMEHSLIVQDIQAVYPTLTYPCHTSIISGEYPGTHGIIHNEKLCPQTNNDTWYWDYRDVKVKTIFDYAKAKGLTTAAVNWPVSANAPVDYLIPEIWGCKREQDETTLLTAVSENVRSIVERHLPLRNYREYPQMDEFVQACVLDILKKQPDVMFLHQAHLDHTRHVHGIHNDVVKDALRQHDVWIQEVITCLKEMGTYEDTTFIILGDHGQLDIRQNLCLNTLLRKEGFLTIDEQGTITSTRAYVQSAGISAHVYVEDESILPQVKAILEMCKNEGYLSHIFTAEEVRETYHLDHTFAFVIEASDGLAFKNQAVGNLIESIDLYDYKTGSATHGHLPSRGECPPFILHNGGHKVGLMQGGSLLDEAATILDLLKITDINMTGKSFLS